MFNNEQIGALSPEKDSVVVFTREQVSELASYLDCTDEQLIEQYQGAVCDNLELNTFVVHKMVAVQKDGGTQTVVVIGLDQEKFVRFLDEKEPIFGDFLQNHPLFSEIDWSQPRAKNDEIFNQIAAEYKKKNLEQ